MTNVICGEISPRPLRDAKMGWPSHPGTSSLANILAPLQGAEQPKRPVLVAVLIYFIFGFIGIPMVAGCKSEQSKPEAANASFASEAKSSTTNQYISVGGSIKKEGRYGFTDGMTLQDAIDLAGGPTEFANRIQVVHRDLKTERLRVRDLPTKGNILLKPGDIIYFIRD